MSKKHNKKRNTVFLYEILVRELTRCIIKKDEERKSNVLSIVREHFKRGSVLQKELQLYKDTLTSEGMDPYTAEKYIFETKAAHQKIDKKEVFKEQSAVIRKINKFLSKSVFSNFVPNYKDLATLSQLFDEDITVKNKVLLEKKIIANITSTSKEKKAMESIGELAYKTFIEKFNSQYKGLLAEQRQLLNYYITSFSDNGVDLKIFLNEEIGRLKDIVNSSLKLDEVKEDSNMLDSTKKVLNLIEGFKKAPIDEDAIKQILKMQILVREIQS
tara:strand:+ start:524 stop:1339 length:816 start_codon:yes stop_codon:yes gene_type:complete